MFFNLVLLSRQHKGQFGIAWIAGTRGIQYVNKKDVLELDVGKLCENIAKFVCSESDSPRSRFSLRLSAVLINGMTKIHRQKSVYFLDELVKYLTSISSFSQAHVKPQIAESELFATPPSPVTKVKGKRRRVVEKETPQSQLEQIIQKITAQEAGVEVEPTRLTLEPVLQTRIDDITLREVQPQIQDVITVGDIGILREEDLAQLQELGIQSLEMPPRERPEEIERLPVAPVPLAPTSPAIAPVTITVEAQVHVSASPEAAKQIPEERPPPPEAIRETPVEEVRAPPREEPVEAEIPAPPPLQIPEQMQVDVVSERDKQISALKIKKKAEEDLSKLLITNKPPKFVRIDRCGPDDLELVEINPCPLPEFRLATPNLTNLLNLYMVRDVRDVQREKRSDVSSLRDSLALQKKSGQLTPVEISEEERTRIIPVSEEPTPQVLPLPTDVPAPLIASTPLSTRRIEVEVPQIEEPMREEVMAAAPEEPVIASPKKKRRLLDVEPALVSDVLMAPEIPSREFTGSAVFLPQETVIEPVMVPLIPEKNRQQEIVNKVFQSERDRLTLEELCSKPINKLNVARTFNDLLGPVTSN